MQSVAVKYGNLKAEMARRGVTVQDLAELTGVTTVTIRNKLSGKSKWTIDDADTIARYFDTTIEYLFLEG